MREIKPDRPVEHGPEAPDGLQVFGLAEVQALAEQGYGVIPLVERLDQTETAGALYERLRGDGPSFMMESSEIEKDDGHYSFIGLKPDAIIRLEKDGMYVNGEPQDFEDPYEFVDELVTKREVAPVAGLPPMFGGAAGLFSYDLARYREPSIGPAKEDKLELPEMALIVPGITLAIDHYKQQVSIIRNITLDPGMGPEDVASAYGSAVNGLSEAKRSVLEPAPVPAGPSKVYEDLEFESNMSPDEFIQTVVKGKKHAEAGDTFQVVPSQRFSSDKPVDRDFAHAALKKLKRLNPSRYAFIFEFGDFEVAGCSPEMLVKVTGSHIEHMAIAGTRKRGQTEEEDKALADELRNDPKEKAEHSMLVDLSRNDVSRVSVAGSVEVPVHAAVENHSHVMHMTSKIIGELKKGQSALDALASISPAGTLSGAPKIRAMQIIDEMEPDKRGFYGGAVGFVSPAGNLNSCICIRSLVVDKKGFVHVQAGAGVVADSVPQMELEETFLKAAAPLRAIEALSRSDESRQELLGTEDDKNEAVNPSSANSHRTAIFDGKRALLLDNYDSYTYNLGHYLEAAGVKVEILRNDVSFEELSAVKPDFLVVSPGPGSPEDAGFSIDAMKYFPEKGVPSLGVCLGHQALVMAFGGRILRHKPMHGKASAITHDGQTIFRGLENPLEIQRYHSLVADPDLPDELIASAHFDEDGQRVVMAVRHTELPAEGVQFHPESFYTATGHQMIRNFVGYTGVSE
jgi:anthranilate synthase component 1